MMRICLFVPLVMMVSSTTASDQQSRDAAALDEDLTKTLTFTGSETVSLPIIVGLLIRPSSTSEGMPMWTWALVILGGLVGIGAIVATGFVSKPPPPVPTPEPLELPADPEPLNLHGGRFRFVCTKRRQEDVAVSVGLSAAIAVWCSCTPRVTTNPLPRLGSCSMEYYDPFGSGSSVMGDSEEPSTGPAGEPWI